WTSLNGLNYWEEDPATGKSPGTTAVVKVGVRTASDATARFQLELAYHPPDKPNVLLEKRTIEVGAPDADGGYVMDWVATFAAGEGDVVLKGGISAGGYSGLSVRIAKESTAWQAIDSEGRKDTTIHGQKARWMD